MATDIIGSRITRNSDQSGAAVTAANDDYALCCSSEAASAHPSRGSLEGARRKGYRSRERALPSDRRAGGCA